MVRRKVRLSHWISFVLAICCLAPASALAIQPLNVVASFSILGDMVRNVGGDRVQLTVLVGPDSDTHVFQPKPADAKILAEASLVVVNGLGFEGWMNRLVKASGYTGPVAVASQGVKTLNMVDDEHGGKKITDPHAWQDLSNAKIYVANIEAALSQADPDGAGVYKTNAQAYLKKIEEMDAWVRAGFAKVPQTERRVITSHDAFGYFGQAYGVTLLAPTGYSTEAEPSAKTVGQLIRQVKKEKIKALFVENITDPRIMERIAQETGTHTGGSLYADTLSGPNGPASTYLEMFRNNAGKMIAAMTAP